MISAEEKHKLDKSFADDIIMDGIPFNSCQRQNWKPICKLVFWNAYCTPHRDKIATVFHPSSFNSVRKQCTEERHASKSLCLSIDGLSDVTKSSVFNTLLRSTIPIHSSSFRLGTEQESAVNFNMKTYDLSHV